MHLCALVQLRCEDKEAEHTVVMATVSIGLPDTRFGVCEVEKVHRSAAPLGAVSVATKKAVGWCDKDSGGDPSPALR